MGDLIRRERAVLVVKMVSFLLGLEIHLRTNRTLTTLYDLYLLSSLALFVT